MLVLSRKTNEIVKIGNTLYLKVKNIMDYGKHIDGLQVEIVDTRKGTKYYRYLSDEPIHIEVETELVELTYLQRGKGRCLFRLGFTAPETVNIIRDDSYEALSLFEDEREVKEDILAARYKDELSWFFN